MRSSSSKPCATGEHAFPESLPADAVMHLCTIRMVVLVAVRLPEHSGHVHVAVLLTFPTAYEATTGRWSRSLQERTRRSQGAGPR